MMNLFIFCFVALQLSAVPALAQVFRLGKCPELPSMSTLDINRYLGKWHEIARFPNFFEGGKCGTAQYSLMDNRRIRVLNRYVDSDDKEHTALGDAYTPDKKVPGVLSVSFESTPFHRRGEYRVVETDYDHYSLVTSCSSVFGPLVHMEYAWILSRNPTLPQAEVDRLEALIGDRGFKVSKFKVADQTGCTK